MCVKDFEGRTHVMNTEPHHTTCHLKRQIHTELGVPASEQRLIHKSRQLMDGTLAANGIQAEANISVMGRLRGGADLVCVYATSERDNCACSTESGCKSADDPLCGEDVSASPWLRFGHTKKYAADEARDADTFLDSCMQTGDSANRKDRVLGWVHKPSMIHGSNGGPKTVHRGLGPGGSAYVGNSGTSNDTGWHGTRGRRCAHTPSSGDRTHTRCQCREGDHWPA